MNHSQNSQNKNSQYKRTLLTFAVVVLVSLLSSCTYMLNPNQYSVSSYTNLTGGQQAYATTYSNSYFVPSRGTGSSYLVGEQIQFRGQSPQSGYMSLTAIDPDGTTYVFEENIPVRAGQDFTLPNGKTYSLTPPRGLHRIQAAFSTQPISNTNVVYYVDQNGSVFRVEQPSGSATPNQVRAEANIVLESHFYLR